jgi:hypothetical protein
MVERTFLNSYRLSGGLCSVLNKPAKLNFFSVLIAAIAWLLIYLFRASVPAEGWILWLQPLMSLLLVGGLAGITWRKESERKAGWWLGAYALTGLLLPFGLGLLEREAGVGSPWEILSLLVFANWIIGLAALSRFRRFQNLTALFAGAAVFVVVSMVEDTASNGWLFSLLAAGYGMLVLWWSMTSYWQRLEQKFADENRSELSIRTAAFLVCLLGVLVLGGVLMLVASTRYWDVRGFSWFSGGDRFSDEYARGGVGEGDGIRAATEHAHTFGPVDSEVYLESRQPSLYDVSSEFYGHPQKIRQSRAIALEGEMGKTQPNRTYRNQHASSEFGVSRKPRVSRLSNPGDELVSLLFHFKGRVPAWLGLETYNDYEGGFWIHREPDQIENRFWQPGMPTAEFYRWVDFRADGDRPWMKVRRHEDSPVFGGWDYSAVKIINFRELRIPAPPALEQLYIDKVDKPDFFFVGSDDIPRLNNNSSYIPPDTVIHLLSAICNVYPLIMNPPELSSLSSSGPTVHDVLAIYRLADFVPEEIQRTAREWTRPDDSDWERVAQITTRLRREFKLDRDLSLPEGETDAAGFLLRQQVGNDYMFATTAVFMFRSLGIPSRVVKGFFADSRNYDPKTRHTGIVGSDIHIWAEVCLDGEFWVPVEPSPGYPQPRYQLNWWQRISLAVFYLKKWIIRNPLSCLLLLAAIGIAAWNYRWLLDRLNTLIWWGRVTLWPQELVLESARLVEKRSRLAGQPRPIAMTPTRFSRQIAGQIDADWIDQAEFKRYLEMLNRALYHPDPQPLSDQEGVSAYKDCRNILAKLNYRELLKSNRSRKQGVSGTVTRVRSTLFQDDRV